MTTAFSPLHLDLGVAALRADWRTHRREDALADASGEAQRIYGELANLSNVAELEAAIATAAERGHVITPPAGAVVSWRASAHTTPHKAVCTDYAASARAFREEVEREGLGASEVAQFPLVHDRDGVLIAHISYNGRCWPGTPSQWQAGHSRPLAEYSPTEPALDVGRIERLAQEIRRVDGDHSLGAATLAEALLPFLQREYQAHPEALAQPAPASSGPVRIVIDKEGSDIVSVQADVEIECIVMSRDLALPDVQTIEIDQETLEMARVGETHQNRRLADMVFDGMAEAEQAASRRPGN